MAPRARHKLLLTGFGPFGTIADNPSGRILPALQASLEELLGAWMTITARRLGVQFGAIDACDPAAYDMAVSLGVDAKATSIRVETHACNHFIDLEGRARAIDETQLAPLIAGKPLPPLPSQVGNWEVTEGTASSAGTFVCNQTYYTLCRTQGTHGYFIHIPNVEPDHDGAFVSALTELIGVLLHASSPATAAATP